MSIEFLKQQIAALQQERRNELMGWLIDLRSREDDPQHAQRTASVLDDKNSTRWVPWDEVERRLDNLA